MIYDCFPFFNELDLLEIRLNELKGVVDKHVIVESTVTFSGNRKRLFYEENKERFSEFDDKIINIVMDDPLDGMDLYGAGNAWAREHFQRNSISIGLEGCDLDDLIILGDVDELISADAIVEGKDKVPCRFDQKLYYFWFNCLVGNWASAPCMIKYRDLSTAVEIRLAAGRYVGIKNGGWHFSFLGNAEEIICKMESYSHQEYNNCLYKNKCRVEEKIVKCQDLFDRDLLMSKVELDDTYPRYLLDNRERFSRYIKE